MVTSAPISCRDVLPERVVLGFGWVLLLFLLESWFRGKRDVSKMGLFEKWGVVCNPFTMRTGSSFFNQKFQVPKMEVLYLIRLLWGWGFPYISRIHTSYIGFRTSILGTWFFLMFFFSGSQEQRTLHTSCLFHLSPAGWRAWCWWPSQDARLSGCLWLGFSSRWKNTILEN